MELKEVMPASADQTANATLATVDGSMKDPPRKEAIYIWFDLWL